MASCNGLVLRPLAVKYSLSVKTLVSFALHPLLPRNLQLVSETQKKQY